MMIPVYTCFAIVIIDLLSIGNIDINRVVGVLPGLIMLMISVMAKGNLGSGDAYLIMAAGLMVGIKDIVDMVIVASAMAFVFAVSVCLIRKIKLESIPFVPFLLCGYLGVLIKA